MSGKHRGPAEPMPDWQPGDVVQVGGATLLRRTDRMWSCSDAACGYSGRSLHDDVELAVYWENGDVRVVLLAGELVAA